MTAHYRAVDQFTGRHGSPDTFWRALADANLRIADHEAALNMIAELEARLDEVTAERNHLLHQLQTSRQGGVLPSP